MSASASLLTSVGSAWYSAWTRSGAFFALCAVRILVTRVSPDACFFTVTVICAFLPGPLFHRSTTLSMPGAQDQYVSDTGPDSDLLSSPEPQAARPVAPSVTARAQAALLSRCGRLVFGMDLSPDLGPPPCAEDLPCGSPGLSTRGEPQLRARWRAPHGSGSDRREVLPCVCERSQ